MIIFLHIPKTGGLSLTTILQNEYGNNFARVERRKALEDEMTQRKIHCIGGHFNFGWHKWIEEKCHYITILRDPVERIISHYFFVLRSPDHHVYKKLIESNEKLKCIPEYLKELKGKEKAAKLIHKKIGLAGYVLSGITDQTDNAQTRMLSGISAPFGKCTKEMFMEAKNNLNNHFVAVGLTERFDESVQLFRRKLKWKRGYKSMVENKRVDLHIRFKLDNESRGYIRSFNNYDIELYNYALMLFGREQCQL